MHPIVTASLALLLATTGDARSWYVHGTDPVVLTHGTRETDDQDFVATCRAHTGHVRVTLLSGLPHLGNATTIPVHVDDGGSHRRYAAFGAFYDERASIVPVLDVDATDPLFDAIAHTDVLHIAVGNATTRLATRGAAGPVATFITSCR
jgi:hypothetical protein